MNEPAGLMQWPTAITAGVDSTEGRLDADAYTFCCIDELRFSAKI